jgi:transcriptional regulator with XRE-family HTH domain
MFTNSQRLENYKRLENIENDELAARFGVSLGAVWWWLHGGGMKKIQKLRLVELEMEYLVGDKSLLSLEAKRMLQDGYARAGKSL